MQIPGAEELSWLEGTGIGIASLQEPGTGERSGLYTGTSYRGKTWPLHRYQIQRESFVLCTGTHTRYRGEVLAFIQVPGTEDRYGLYAGTGDEELSWLQSTVVMSSL